LSNQPFLFLFFYFSFLPFRFIPFQPPPPLLYNSNFPRDSYVLNVEVQTLAQRIISAIPAAASVSVVAVALEEVELSTPVSDGPACSTTATEVIQAKKCLGSAFHYDGNCEVEDDFPEFIDESAAVGMQLEESTFADRREGHEAVGAAHPLISTIDTWLVHCGMAPTEAVRNLALDNVWLKDLELNPLVSVAAHVCTASGMAVQSSTVGGGWENQLGCGLDQVSSGLPFLVDGPFFCHESSGPIRSLYLPTSTEEAQNVSPSPDGGGFLNASERAKIAEETALRRASASGGGADFLGEEREDNLVVGCALIEWNLSLLEAAMVKIVPELLDDLKNKLQDQFRLKPSSL
jgi:hypothetical protein